MPVNSYSTEQFLEDYEFAVARDFEKNGQPPQWAPGYPKHWGEEDDSFECSTASSTNETIYDSFTADLSPDESLLAISRGKAVYIYSVAEKALQQTLKLTGRCAQVHFRPHAFDQQLSRERSDEAAYILAVGITDKNHQHATTCFYDLDAQGRSDTDEGPLDVKALASQAVESFLPDLIGRGWTKENVKESGMEEKFQNIIGEAETARASRDIVSIAGGTNGFSSQGPFSSDGKFFLSYRRSGRQARANDTIVVIEVSTKREKFILSGHTDFIMWSGWSPDLRYIATVAWDSTMRMYSADNGELLWATADTGSQAWTAAFSPDSTHILHSTSSGHVVNMHAVLTGETEACLVDKEIDGQKVNRWIRNVGWHPSGATIVLAPEDGTGYEMDPFATPPKVLQKFVMKRESHMPLVFGHVHIYWADEGKKIVVRSSEHTYDIWDRQRHLRWRMVRPKGTKARWSRDCWWLLKDGAFLTVDGDMKVRFWKLE